MKDIASRHNIPYNLRPVGKVDGNTLTVLSVCVTANHWYIYDLSWKDVFG